MLVPFHTAPMRNIRFIAGFRLLRDEYAQFQDVAEVMGISSDPPEVNAEFAKARQNSLWHGPVLPY